MTRWVAGALAVAYLGACAAHGAPRFEVWALPAEAAGLPLAEAAEIVNDLAGCRLVEALPPGEVPTGDAAAARVAWEDRCDQEGAAACARIGLLGQGLDATVWLTDISRRLTRETLAVVIAHELGHSLGLSHAREGLMAPRIDMSNLGASAEERAALARLCPPETDG